MIQESLNFKQQLLVHAVGDKTIQDVFDAMEKYSAKVEWSLERVRIEHGDGMIDDLVPRARKFGVIVVQNPAHFSEPGLFHQRWGAKMFPLRSLIEAGIPIALGSDGPMNPFLEHHVCEDSPVQSEGGYHTRASRPRLHKRLGFCGVW
jgi:predicted amidohydrolase YtcJ